MCVLSVNWGNIFTVVGFGFGMVVAILCLLVILLILFEKLMTALNNRSERKIEKEKELKKTLVNIEDLSSDEAVAISLAIYLYFDEIHDKESNVITIRQLKRRYSPWNSKIFGVQ